MKITCLSILYIFIILTIHNLFYVQKTCNKNRFKRRSIILCGLNFKPNKLFNIMERFNVATIQKI